MHFGEKHFRDTKILKRHLFLALCTPGTALSGPQHRLLDERLGSGRMRFYAGRRSPAQYAFDLFSGWLVEDLLKQRFVDAGQEIETIGDDREREFLVAPSASSDWLLAGEEVECFVDFLGTWEKQGYLDLKPGKMRRLLNSKMRLYCHVLPTNRSFWMGKPEILAQSGGIEPKPVFHPQWSKEVFQIGLPRA